MYWPDTQTGVDVEPARKPVASAVRKFFTEGGLGQAPTVPGGDWFNQITNELLNVLSAAGIDPSKLDDNQLLQAIQTLSKVPGVMTRGNDKFSIMQGRSGEYRQDTLTRGLAIELNDPITGGGFAGATNTYMFNRFRIANDRVDAQNDATPGTKVDGLIVQHDFGGAGTRGGRHAAEFMLSQNAATESDNTDRHYVGVVGYCYTNSGDGGTSETDKRGAYFGGNFYTSIKNAPFVFHANGCESNVTIDSASSAYYRCGYSAVSGGDLQATMYDAAYSVGALGVSGAQWRDGILMGVQNGRNPISRSMIRGEDLSVSKIISFSGSIPSGIITSDTDTRFNFRVDRLEMFYANASLKIGAKDAVNTPVIDAYTDASGNRAGRLIFTGTAATPDNGVCNVHFRQTVVRELAPGAANTFTCGTASLPWAGGFTQTAFTVTSDERLKVNIASILNSEDEDAKAEFRAMRAAWRELDLFIYQLIDRVEKKGPTGARWHLGVLAQRAIDAFTRHGLDWTKYSIFNYDEWNDQWGKVITNEGATVTKTRIVQRQVVETVVCEVLVEEEQEDGSILRKLTKVDRLVPKFEPFPIFKADGSPQLAPDGSQAVVFRPVMEDVEEEYTEPAEPEYEDVLEVAAGSRYHINYEEAFILAEAVRREDQATQDAFNRDLLERLTLLETQLSGGN